MVPGDEFDQEDYPALQILPLGASLGAEVFTFLGPRGPHGIPSSVRPSVR